MEMQPVQPVVAPVQRPLFIHLWWARFSILLVAAVLAAFATIATYRYTATPAAPAIRSDRAPATYDPYHYMKQEYRSAPAAQPALLGIELPNGAKKGDLPSGLTDYLRPQSADDATKAQPAPLGIDLPEGANPSETGLADYVRGKK